MLPLVGKRPRVFWVPPDVEHVPGRSRPGCLPGASAAGDADHVKYKALFALGAVSLGGRRS
jgi:hypothetical protein